ncbi:MAG TPA: hypothetical protein VM913_00825 [Sphingomicrobium sp.]|nr:hypothetical protein [Sphingomicrobium sp.]
MIGLESILAIGAVALTALVIAAIVALRGWQGWLELKKMELARDGGGHDGVAPLTGGRIEIADLKERVRKLEQIASGLEY